VRGPAESETCSDSGPHTFGADKPLFIVLVVRFEIGEKQENGLSFFWPDEVHCQIRQKIDAGIS